MARAGRLRRHRVLIGVLVVLVVAFLALTAVLFVWPATNAPRRVDAIVVLGGSGDRIAKGLALARDGYAPFLVISDHDEAPCPKGPPGVRVICFNPNPASTQGEAEAVARMATDHRWDSLIVVSSIPQTTRARIRFDRCFNGSLLFVPTSPGGLSQWLYGVVYEWGALAKALTIQRGC